MISSDSDKYQHRHYREQRQEERERVAAAIDVQSLHDAYVGYVQLANIEQSLASITDGGTSQQHLQRSDLYRNAATVIGHLINDDVPGVDAEELFSSAARVAREIGDRSSATDRLAKVLITHGPSVRGTNDQGSADGAAPDDSSAPATDGADSGGSAGGGGSGAAASSGSEESDDGQFDVDTVSDDIVEFTTDVSVTFDDVGGYDDVVQELEDQVIERVEKRHLFEAGEFSVSGGVMLVGPPGTGKTLLARAVCGEAGWAVGEIQCANATSALFGKSAKRIEAIFDRAKSEAEERPTMLFFDEIDTLVPDRSRNTGTSAGNDQMVTAFLTEMNKLAEESHDLIVVGASNTPKAVDSAVIDNSQRMRAVIEMPLPDVDAREEIFDVHLAAPKTSGSIDTRDLAERTEGFSGSDIEAVVSNAYTAVVRRTPADAGADAVDPITQDLLEAKIDDFADGDAGDRSFL